jgi:hypothetical protein
LRQTLGISIVGGPPVSQLLAIYLTLNRFRGRRKQAR